MGQTMPPMGRNRLSVDELLNSDENDEKEKKDGVGGDIQDKIGQTDGSGVTGLYSEDEIVRDDSFSYNGYQVVRGEFFAHIYEPSICFNQNKVYVNMGCLKRMQDVDYVQILVNSEEKKLVIRPAGEDEKDAFLWCSIKKGMRKPKQITCRVFFAKIMSLMSWNADYRYKLLGKVIRSGEEKLVVFDLNATEIYLRKVKEGGKTTVSKKPVFPAEWENQFGLPVEEHRKLLQVNIFKGYTVFGIQENRKAEDNVLGESSTRSDT